MLTLEWLRRKRVDPEVQRRSGHPPIDRPYFAEYKGLLEAGGTGFAAELSYDRYVLDPGEPDPALEHYLRTLIGHAAAGGERPVLCFVRSPLRALWMKRRFGGLHIAQLRNPRDQWGSFIGQGGERSYFMGATILIASRLQGRFPQVLSHLAELAGAPGSPVLPKVEVNPKGGLISRGRPIGSTRGYAVFTLLWLAGALQSLSAADIVLDCDRLALDAGERRRVAARLAGEGLEVDLSDVEMRRHGELPLDVPALQAIEQLAVRQIAGDARPLLHFDAARVAAALDQLSSESRGLVESALGALRATAG
jgi:hypothetical protein